MKFEDPMPPNILDANILRKAKEEEINGRLGITSSGPIQNLQIEKYEL